MDDAISHCNDPPMLRNSCRHTGIQKCCGIQCFTYDLKELLDDELQSAVRSK